MALVVYWYDFICFAVVVASIVVALWALIEIEAARKPDGSAYESLLVCSQIGMMDNVGVTPFGHVSSTQLWTSCWRGVHPLWLLLVRVIAVGVLVGILTWDVVLNDLSIFIYYTEWTVTLTIIYFMLSVIISANGCWEYSKSHVTVNTEENSFLTRDIEESKSTITTKFRTDKIRGSIKVQSHHEQEEINKRAGFWGYMMQTLYQTCAGAVFLTDIVFWCVIVPFIKIERLDLSWLMGCQHTCNAIFLLLDTSLNSLPFPWFRLSYFVLWSSLYVLFQWVIHACGFSWWPYPFLELSTPWAPLWYVCLALIHLPCYGLYALIVKGKNTYFSKWFPLAYVRSS